ncbi:hypothetical protein SAY87_023429 [Trapa incisa]|uniref:BHLH domain-containing protein n=1 Tax=Trapa incisa TaxID=236973 RepID=A0AAN7KSJ6_9MYRT|nr:hypothetical protein SAY87_023429 [Trapa incisa]
MAHDFTGTDFHGLIRTPISSFLDMDSSMGQFHFPDHHLINPAPISVTAMLDASSAILPSALNLQNQNHLMGFPEFPGSLADTIPAGIMFHTVVGEQTPIENEMRDSRKRKDADVVSESSSRVSSHSSPASGCVTTKKTDSGKAKRLKNVGKLEEGEEEEKQKEVVHVRARRGQATDSHSLAERVRRGKINEKLRCLQDIVPGCYKTMGLAVMLDEIINYVQSLQSQVEFLSMKLTAASSYYDFNSESDAIDKMQRAMAGEPKELQRVAREGSHEGTQSNNFHSRSWHH